MIPEEIGNLNNLKNLSMDNNQITGLFTVNLFNKSSLEYLSLRNNELSGYIPREIGNFTMLKKLYLQNNTFTGMHIVCFRCELNSNRGIKKNNNYFCPRMIGLRYKYVSKYRIFYF